MSTALPGQRAAQSPLRAAITTQRALGRAASNSAALADTFVLNVGGRWQQVAVDPDDGSDLLVPYDFGATDTQNEEV